MNKRAVAKELINIAKALTADGPDAKTLSQIKFNKLVGSRMDDFYNHLNISQYHIFEFYDKCMKIAEDADDQDTIKKLKKITEVFDKIVATKNEI